jgi:surface polysaccharide O-acyltransferase-like enzyme
MSNAPRFVEIDALKVAGIVTVVLIHTIRAPWDPSVAPLEVWIGHATRFGVPAFLFASGFLYATRRPVPRATVGGRLQRILLPYLVASIAAQLFRAARDLPGETGSGSIVLDLLIGASFGPYYYVFVIAVLVVATPLYARLSGRALVAVLAFLVAGQWLADAGSFGLVDLRWHLRNPLLWWAHFLLGWCVRLHLARVQRGVAEHRGPLLFGLAVAVAALTAASALEGSAPRMFVRSAAWLDIYAILALVWVLASRIERPPIWLRETSDATYALYLFHLFFLLPAKAWFPPPAGSVAWQAIALPWAIGLAGPLALVFVARAVLGTRSRSVIGA